jgi:hypothetical protein
VPRRPREVSGEEEQVGGGADPGALDRQELARSNLADGFDHSSVGL